MQSSNLEYKNEKRGMSIEEVSHAKHLEVFQLLNVSDISPDPNQPRKAFDLDSLQSLADSLNSPSGQIKPITVKPIVDTPGKYMIVAGERRWRASKLGNRTQIKALIKNNEDADNIFHNFSVQYNENEEFVNLNPVEKGEFINEFIEKLTSLGYTEPKMKAAQCLGKSQSYISKKLSILKYKPELRKLARSGVITDYAVLTKLNSLKSQKLNEAITKIGSGEFVAKEFFKRKRYDVKKKTEDETTNKKVDKTKRITTSMKDKEWTSIIDKTEFRFLLDDADKNWRKAEFATMKSYIAKFREWALTETD